MAHGFHVPEPVAKAAADDTEGIDRALLNSIVDKHMAMIPTLKLFGAPNGKNLQPIAHADARARGPIRHCGENAARLRWVKGRIW
jgi:hypothetical protein